MGVFAGIIAGTIGALLFAPKSGRELREDITEKTDDLKKLAQDKKDELVMRAKQSWKDLRDEVDEE